MTGTPKVIGEAYQSVLEKRVKAQRETMVELLDERDNWRMVARLSQTLMVLCVMGMIFMGIVVLSVGK